MIKKNFYKNTNLKELINFSISFLFSFNNCWLLLFLNARIISLSRESDNLEKAQTTGQYKRNMILVFMFIFKHKFHSLMYFCIRLVHFICTYVFFSSYSNPSFQTCSVCYKMYIEDTIVNTIPFIFFLCLILLVSALRENFTV